MAIPSLKHSLALLTLLSFSTIARGDVNPVQQFNTEPFTLPEFHVVDKGGANDGYLFLGLTAGGDLDWSGSTGVATSHGPVLLKQNGDLVWHGPVYADPYNVRRQTLNGSNVLTYWRGKSVEFGHGYGYVQILDENYHQMYNVCVSSDQLNIVTPNEKIYPNGNEKPCLLDRHESYITDQGTLVANVFNVTRADLSRYGGPKNGWIFDSMFVEVDIPTSKVLFTWSSLEKVGHRTTNYLNDNPDHPQLFLNEHIVGSDRKNPWDFFHMNSVQKVPGGYIANSRMTWSFYMINGTTGNVEWTLEGSKGGDFKLLDPIHFTWQHMPRILNIDGDKLQINLFNNDNIPTFPERKNSTGLLLEVDTKAMTVKKMRDLFDDTSPVVSTAEGSYQSLENNHVLLGYGSGPFIQEFDENNKMVYQMEMGTDHGEHKQLAHSYRAYKYTWNGQPQTKPKAAVCNKDGNKQLHMSWNGATQVSKWNCWTGSSQDNLKKVATDVEHARFENHCNLDNSPRYAMVEAMDGSGKSLSNSTAFEVPSLKDLPKCVPQPRSASVMLKPNGVLALAAAIGVGYLLSALW